MKRKMIAGILIFVMLFSLMPTMALAAEGASLSGGTLTISGTGSASGNGWSWENSTLTLSAVGEQGTVDDINNIDISGVTSVTIDVKRDVTLNSSATSAIWFNTSDTAATLTIKSSNNSSLTATKGIRMSDTSNNYKPCGTIYITSGTINVLDDVNALVASEVNISEESGTTTNVTITVDNNNKYAVQGYLRVSGGTVRISGEHAGYAITGGSLTINGTPRYVITYDPNDGEGEVYSYYWAGSSITLPTEPKISNYFEFTEPADKPYFKGWATDSNATDVVASPYALTGHTTFYAIWTDEPGIQIDNNTIYKTGNGWKYETAGNKGTLSFTEDVTLKDVGIRFTFTSDSSSINEFVINIPTGKTVTINLDTGNCIEFLNNTESQRECKVSFIGGGTIICNNTNGTGIYKQTEGNKGVNGSVFVGENTTIVTTGSNYGIRFDGDLILEAGSEVTANGDKDHGLKCNNITLKESSKLTAKSNTKKGIECLKLIVDGGTLKAEGVTNGLYVSNGIVINSGKINAATIATDETTSVGAAIGLHLTGITANGGTITAESGNTSISAISATSSVQTLFSFTNCMTFTSPVGASYDKDADWYVYTNSEKTTVANEVVISAVHTGGTATCTTKAKCEVCATEYGDLDLLAHTVVTDAAVAPTCTATGATEGSHCSECGTVIVAQTVVEKVEHTYGSDNICDVCGDKKASTTTTTTSSGGGFSGTYNYPVSTPTTDNGSVTLSDNNASAGETVTATVKPDKGYGVAEVIVTDSKGNVIPVTYLGNGEYSFVMPAGKVNIETVCKPAITLTIGSQMANVFGKNVKNDVAPIITAEGRTMLPIRFIAEALGADVSWNADTQTVTITKDGVIVQIIIGADYAYINGKKVKLDAKAFIANGRTYLPVRFISEALGADVNWDAATKQVVIMK